MLLDQLYWKFGVKKYPTQEAFIHDLKEYTKMLAPELTLDPNQKIINAGAIEVICEREEEEFSMVVAGDDQESLKLGELLFTINNESLNFFDDQDVAYLEGLSAFDVQEEPPVYKLMVRD